MIGAMKDRQRWLPFLLLNIFISAAVTGAILFWYDRTYRQSVVTSAPVSAATSSASVAAPPAKLSPDEDVSVDIVSVIGSGTLDAEVVLIRYTGEGVLDLAGWYLKDEDKKIFLFPQLTLYPEGAVQVHTVAGQNTVVDLYWGLRNPVWESGEEATLFDSQEIERASYIVP